MLHAECDSISVRELQPTVSAKRRLQNRVAQQKFRERQKNRASRGSGTTAAQNELQNSPSWNSLDSSHGDDHQYLWDEPFLADTGDSTSSLLAPDFARFLEGSSLPNDQSLSSQWYTNSPSCSVATHDFLGMPPIDSVASSPGNSPANWTPTFNAQQNLLPPALPFEHQYDGEMAEQRSPHTSYTSPSYSAPTAFATPISSGSSSLASPPGSYSSLNRPSTSISSQIVAAQRPSPSGGYTPPHLHVAIRTRNKSVVRILLQRGASTVDERDNQGCTALHLASQQGDEAMVQLLLQHGADPTARDERGLDALHWAVEEGCCEVIEALLDAIARRREGAAIEARPAS